MIINMQKGLTNMADFSMGTLYAMNQDNMAKEPSIKPNTLKKLLKQKVVPQITKVDDSYFMMLCKELSDYTIFKFSNKKEDTLSAFVKDIHECILNRGRPLAVDLLKEDNDAVEIWIKVEGIPHMYYFFPCEPFIIEEGREYN